jgi:hypothetical protein
MAHKPSEFSVAMHLLESADAVDSPRREVGKSLRSSLKI